jgi:putative cell wall-binding protein
MTAALTLGSFAALVGPAHATANVTTNRIAGVNRYATAVQIAETKFPTGAQNAILTSGLNYPDALAGGYLAGLDAAPILLTDPMTLSPETQAALGVLKTKNVIILGGTDAVSAAVETAVGAMTTTSPVGGPVVTSRVFGPSRYDTMQVLDQQPAITQVGVYQDKATAIIAQGLNFADALAASPVSYKNHLPIVLSDPVTLLSQAQQVLQNLNIRQVLIMGGTSAISAAEEQAINALGITTVARFTGVDRTDTAQQLAQFENTHLGFTNNEVVLTRGDIFPDALAGGVYAGDPKPILLTEDPTTLGSFTSNYLATFQSAINKITVLGGTSALSDPLVAEAAADASNNGNGGGAGGGGSQGGGGGNGGGGNVFPAGTPVTAAPDLITANITFNGFATGQPSEVQYTFDKSVVAITTHGNNTIFTLTGPDLRLNVFHPGVCVIDPNGVAVDCQFAAGQDIANNTIAEVDGGAVIGTGALPNVLGAVTLGGGNLADLPQPVLVSAAVSSVAFNQITYTFNQNVQLIGGSAVAAADFGFGTTDGNTEFIGGASAVPSANNVTVTFPAPAATGVPNANYFFVLAAAVRGTSSGVQNVITDWGTLPAQRPNLVSVQRQTAPNQFLFTVDKPALGPTTATLLPGNFLVYQNVAAPAPVGATGVVPLSNTQFLATFPPGVISTNNTSTFDWGAITQNVTFPNVIHTAAVKNIGAPGAFNAVGAIAIPGATTAVANGPVLQAFSASIGASQGTFSFDRPVVAASVIPKDFFVVENNGAVVAGTGVVGVVNNQVVIKFPSGSVTSLTVGGGLIGPDEDQLGINGTNTVPAGAVTDSAGNPALGSSTAGNTTP